MKSYVKGKKDTPSEDGAVTVVAKVRPTFTPSGELFYEMISGTTIGTCEDCKHRSEKSFPAIGYGHRTVGEVTYDCDMLDEYVACTFFCGEWERRDG